MIGKVILRNAKNGYVVPPVVFVRRLITCLRTVSTSENDSSTNTLYELMRAMRSLHIFRDIFQKSSEHSDLNFCCVLNKFHKHIECSSTRTASIRESGTSVLEDLKALSWKTCQEEQTATGKEISNPFLADSLLKTIRLSLHLVIATKH
ncbi:hypothetical protein Tco_0401088 [Tanacetum coccineum]